MSDTYTSRFTGEEIDDGIKGGLNAVLTSDVVQATGQSQTSVMSQKAVTDAINIATPVRGVDYYTPNDIDYIVTTVADVLRTNALVGFVDEDNNIVLSGNIGSGTYALKYENGDGDVIDVCSLTIAGDEPEPATYTNLTPTLLATDLVSIYNQIGYKENTRYSISVGKEVTATGTTMTGLFPLGNDGDVLHFRGVNGFSIGSGNSEFTGFYLCYDSSGALLTPILPFVPTTCRGVDVNSDYTITLTHSLYDIPTGTEYIRFGVGKVTGDVIITRNELITD